MGFKNVMKNIGKVALKAAPIAASFIPGVGPLASMAIGAASSAADRKLSGGSWKDAGLAGAMGGASGYLSGGVKGLSPGRKVLSAGLAAPGILAGMGGSSGGGQQQQQQAAPQQRGQARGPANAGMGARMGAAGARMGPGGMRRMGGGIGPSGGFDPYYNASLPGTRAGVNFNTEGPSFGDDPSGLINQRNPTMNPDLPFVQRGTSGGYTDRDGITIGAGRSISPAQYQAQIAQAQQAGIPQSWIQGFLQANPGDSNRLLEAYASEDEGAHRGAMQGAMQTPWQQFEGQTPQMPMPQYGGGGGQLPPWGNMPVGGNSGGMETMPTVIPGFGNTGVMPPQGGGLSGPNRKMMMGRRSATQGRMGGGGIGPSMPQ